MEKKSIQITIGRNFHFMTGSDPREYDHFNSIIDPVAKIEYVTNKTATASPWVDETTEKVFWRPSLGNIYVSLESDYKDYETVSGAYKEAVRIKRLLQEKVGNLKRTYQRRHLNNRIIKDYLSERGSNVYP